MSSIDPFSLALNPEMTDIRRWRVALQKRYEAGDMYDRLSLEQRALFNKMAADFVGSGVELVLCAEAIVT